MSTPLRRFGSRYEERLADLDRPAKLPTQQTAGQLISDYARHLDTLEKVAQQLGLALTKALSTTSWTKDGPLFSFGLRFEVDVTPDCAGTWYLVRVSAEDIYGRPTSPAQTYTVGDEALAERTSSVSTFRAWVEAMADRLRVIFDPTPAPLLLETAEETGRRLQEHRENVREAKEGLCKLGLDTPEDRAPSEAEKQAAIASVRRTLSERSDW